MDNRTKTQILTKQDITSPQVQTGLYQKRGRIAVIQKNAEFINALSEAPQQSTQNQSVFELLNWLIDKPRISGEKYTHFLLNTAKPSDFPGKNIHPDHGLFVDSFNSPHQWEDGDSQAAEQIADTLLPSGQWHRHYDLVILSANANDKQVELIRHWLELTGGSLIILTEQDTKPSIHIQQLIDDLQTNKPSEKIPSELPKTPTINIQSGLQVTVYNADKQLIHSESIPHLHHFKTTLPELSGLHTWSYDGFIEVPQDGTIYFQVALENLTHKMTVELNGEKFIPKTEDNGYFELHNLNAGKKYPLKITTNSEGTPPQFRFGWRFPKTESMVLIPEIAFSHKSLSIPPTTTENSPKQTLSSQIDITNQSFIPHGYQQVISLPSQTINSLTLTPEMITRAEYFSITIKGNRQQIVLKLDDIQLAHHNSWDSLALDIERQINERLVERSLPPIHINYSNNALILHSKSLIFTQFQLKQRHQVPYTNIAKPITTETKNNHTVHAISFRLEQLNMLTHFSLVFNETSSKRIKIERELFRHSNQPFSSPEQFAAHLEHYLHTKVQDNSLSVTWDNEKEQLKIIDPHHRKLGKLNFGYQEQILPFVVVENPKAIPHSLTIGAITGTLPNHQDILEYQLIEAPQHGAVVINQLTGEWRYQPNNHQPFNGNEQFDFVAKMKDGNQSAPMSIHIQSESPPITSIPGKRTFFIPDPIYHQPNKRHLPVPSDMQVQQIQLAQTHLQSPDAPYFNLTANRWALLKVDITSLSAANAPDLTAIVIDKHGKELGRVNLTGPDKLPKRQPEIANTPSINAAQLHRNSYTAPLKGQWMQPGARIKIRADTTPITLPYTDDDGYIALNIHHDNQITTRVTNSTLYQQGHGEYAYSPMSWGMEAAAKLPVNQFTLYSYPAISQSPYLQPYLENYHNHSALFMPKYDQIDPFIDVKNQQIGWSYLDSQISNTTNSYNEELFYSAVQPNNASMSILGLASPNYGGGIPYPDILWHEIYGHGLGLPHTTSKTYPYDAKSNGPHLAYDQQKQRYTTFRYQSENGEIKEIKPSLYPFAGQQGKIPNDAFVPYSDYYIWKAQQNLAKKIRWQPNEQPGQDIEDNHFAGEGFYQCWSQTDKRWITLNQTNFTQYYSREKQHQLAHQRDVPVYWLKGQFLPLPNGELHPYSDLKITRTIGNLPADYYNLDTGKGRPYSYYSPFALKITYSTQSGLLTETLQIGEYHHKMSLNVADKGELVKIEVVKINQQKQIDQVIYQYSNPDALANRVFGRNDENTQISQLQLDNYWHGNKLFWSATDKKLIDFSTGNINLDQLNEKSAICAKWVEDGQLRQQYFQLNNSFKHHGNIETTQPFFAINHLDIHENKRITSMTHLDTVSESLLLSDVHIKQSIDISALNLPTQNNTYWAVLMIYDKQRNIQETTPLESWHLSVKQDILTVNGTIDSTPNLNIVGIKIYIDAHLQDDVPAHSIILHQNYHTALAENIELLNYNQPVIFNSIENQPELFTSMANNEEIFNHQTKHHSSFSSITSTVPLLT